MGFQLWLADVARAAGLTVLEMDGWQTRGSESFAPEGTIWHHTGGGNGEMPTLGMLARGRGGENPVPGPLANYGLGRSGTVYVVAAGRANHAGAGAFHGLAGNSKFIGIEAENKGGAGDPWPAVQLDAYYRLTAAIQAKLERDASYVGGHKEYATPKGRKSDPHTLDMNNVRAQVAAITNHEPPFEGDDDLSQFATAPSANGGIYIFNGQTKLPLASMAELKTAFDGGLGQKDAKGNYDVKVYDSVFFDRVPDVTKQGAAPVQFDVDVQKLAETTVKELADAINAGLGK